MHYSIHKIMNGSSRRPILSVAVLLLGAGLAPFALAKPSLVAPNDLKAPPKSATRTASGLGYQVLRSGGGVRHPKATDKVRVHYSGWTTDGEMFDSSVSRGQPATFPLNRVIKGWTEGLQLMVEGEMARFWIPARLAYGESPRSGAPKGMLIFDVELLEIVRTPKAPAAPKDVLAPPRGATFTKSGLAYRILSRGSSDRRPGPRDKVTVHYSGWTTDGVMFDSSRKRGKPATFPLNGVIKGWTEGLQLMSPKDRFRFWIPARLAYGESPRSGAPKGMLVFDVELLQINGD